LCHAYFSEREGLDERPVEPYWPKWKPYVDFFGKLYADVDRYEWVSKDGSDWRREERVAFARTDGTFRPLVCAAR
jgi:hypothetical protein